MTELSIVINGTDVGGDLVEVFSDASDTLEWTVYFGEITRGTLDPAAPWATAFSVRVGLRKPSSGDWQLFLYARYGSPSNSRPYYTRVTIPVLLVNESSGGEDTINVDVAASTEVIGHGQGIPPTVVTINPATLEVTGTQTDGVALAFVDTKRILGNPNHTGYSQDGEFAIVYDHTVENEDRETFYAAACWPSMFLAADGKALRPDVPDVGQRYGFSTGERGPYANRSDYGATNYPVTHLAFAGNGETTDEDEWDNAYDSIASHERLDSGIGPLCLNIVSRGDSFLRDFGHAWILTDIAARVLGQWPDPTNDPHSQNVFLYNYDDDAMRGKGRILWTMAVLWDALNELTQVRASATDEAVTLRDAMAVRFASILAFLKLEFANGEYLQTRSGGRYVAYWELGHYFQGLLVYQNVHQKVFGTIDAEVDLMMRTFAAEIFENTFEWVNNGPHPRDSGVTYTGAEGWYLEYLKDNFSPSSSNPTTGIGPTMVAVYEWSKANGLNTGSKLDAIIAEYGSVDYKWRFTASTAALSGSASFAAAFTLSVADAPINFSAAADFAARFFFEAAPTVGSGVTARRGTAIVITDVKSVGDPIAVGPQLDTVMGAKAFSVVRNDTFDKPFTPTLDQSRTLDGTESWRFSVRATKSGPLLLELTSPSDIKIEAGTFTPTVKFRAGTFPEAGFPVGEDADYVYDLEMTKDGSVETYAIDILTLIGDISR